LRCCDIFGHPATGNSWATPVNRWQNRPHLFFQRGIAMHIKTASFIVNPCDDEYDDMALLCCHAENGDLFSLTRFPDEQDIEITVGDDKVHKVSQLKVTFSAERLLIELEPADGKALEGHSLYEISHSMAASELQEVEETLVVILGGVGDYVSELAGA
jgi:hypothetical protein